MTFYKSRAKQASKLYKALQEAIPDRQRQPSMTWNCPGESGVADLPDIPSGFRYATLVTVFHRTNGVADGRYRRVIAPCDSKTMNRKRGIRRT